nr:PREDICTED: uncharacterized protein LOC109036356 [Bemisia tabaci]
MPHCSVPGCHETSGKNETRERNIFFHRFPNPEKSPERLQLWVDYCCRDRFRPSNNARVCSKHFEDSNFDTSQLLKIRLMPHANFQGPKLRPGSFPSVPPEVWSAPSSDEPYCYSQTPTEEERKELVNQLLGESSNSPTYDNTHLQHHEPDDLDQEDTHSISSHEYQDDSYALPASHFVRIELMTEEPDPVESKPSSEEFNPINVALVLDEADDSSDGDNTKSIQCELGKEIIRKLPNSRCCTPEPEVSTTTPELKDRNQKRKAIFQLFSDSNKTSTKRPATTPARRPGLRSQRNKTSKTGLSR